MENEEQCDEGARIPKPISNLLKRFAQLVAETDAGRAYSVYGGFLLQGGGLWLTVSSSRKPAELLGYFPEEVPNDDMASI